MQKVFYITKDETINDGDDNTTLPKLNRFKRVDKLNDLLECGWTIKDFITDSNDAFFILEK